RQAERNSRRFDRRKRAHIVVALAVIRDLVRRIGGEDGGGRAEQPGENRRQSERTIQPPAIELPESVAWLFPMPHEDDGFRAATLCSGRARQPEQRDHCQNPYPRTLHCSLADAQGLLTRLW